MITVLNRIVITRIWNRVRNLGTGSGYPVPTANRNDDALYKSLFTYLKLSFMFSVGVCVSTAGRMSSGQPRYNTE